ncbi:MAG: RNA polymerase sigma factor [Rikenellaceae bacterium]
MKCIDDTLVRDIVRGDREAQRELYDRYSAQLMAIAMRYLGDRAVAEDTLHDSFIKIFESIKSFKSRGEGSLRAWMSRIVVNTSLEYLRHQNHHKVISLDEALTHDMKEEEPYGDVGRVPQEVLLRFISELPDGYRTVFNLFCVEEYSHREIAAALGINEKSSSSQLLRAKRLLATKVRDYIKSHG